MSEEKSKNIQREQLSPDVPPVYLSRSSERILPLRAFFFFFLSLSLSDRRASQLAPPLATSSTPPHRDCRCRKAHAREPATELAFAVLFIVKIKHRATGADVCAFFFFLIYTAACLGRKKNFCTHYYYNFSRSENGVLRMQ